MKRKVSQIGPSTLMVSLPSKWVKTNNVKKGDELEIVPKSNMIKISTSSSDREEKSININIDKHNYFAFTKILTNIYESGYDTVKLDFKNQTIHDSVPGHDLNVFDAVNRIVGRLPTFEILMQKENSITLTNISEKLVKLDVITSRIFYLLEEYVEMLLTAINNNKLDDLDSREARHDAIAKYVALALRMLYEDPDKTKTELINNSIILYKLDKAADFMRYAYKHTQEVKGIKSKEAIAIIEDSHKYVKTLRSTYQKYNEANINDLDVLRRDAKQKFETISKTEPLDLYVASNLNHMIELLSGSVKSLVALQEID